MEGWVLAPSSPVLARPLSGHMKPKKGQVPKTISGSLSPNETLI